MNINELDNLSEQELDIIAKRIYAIRNERRHTRVESLIKRFKDAWYELEKEGVTICCNNCYESDAEMLDLDSIVFDY